MDAEEYLRRHKVYESGIFDCPETKQDVIEFAQEYANQTAIDELIELREGLFYFMLDEKVDKFAIKVWLDDNINELRKELKQE